MKGVVFKVWKTMGDWILLCSHQVQRRDSRALTNQAASGSFERKLKSCTWILPCSKFTMWSVKGRLIGWFLRQAHLWRGQRFRELLAKTPRYTAQYVPQRRRGSTRERTSFSTSSLSGCRALRVSTYFSPRRLKTCKFLVMASADTTILTLILCLIQLWALNPSLLQNLIAGWRYNSFSFLTISARPLYEWEGALHGRSDCNTHVLRKLNSLNP